MIKFPLYALLVLLLAAQAFAAPKSSTYVDQNGVAIAGYDPVAFFTDAKPVKGDPKINATYDGAKFYFASREHRTLFRKNPSKYAPAFGGYCANALAKKKKIPGDPNYWQVIQGRLVLCSSAKAKAEFDRNPAANLKKAEENWPLVQYLDDTRSGA
jgi:YHS domain-containing protein